MKIYKYIVITILVTLFSSCQKEINIDIATHEPKLTINCHLIAGSVPEAVISHSIHSTSNSSNLTALPFAEVVLFENNIPVDTLQHFNDSSDSWGNYEVGVFRGDYIIKTGETYKVQVNEDNYETAYGETVCPGNSIEITEIDLTEMRIDSVMSYWYPDTFDYFRTGKLKLKFSGPLNEDLHYFLSITDQNEETPMLISSNDPIIAGEEYNINDGNNYPNENLYFAGSSLNINTTLTIEINSDYSEYQEYMWDYETDFTDGLIIKLEIQNNDYFEFMSKMDDYDQSSYNPFAEMVFLPNNIKGGYGVISARMNYEKTTD